jgi:hypothetical protein
MPSQWGEGDGLTSGYCRLPKNLTPNPFPSGKGNRKSLLLLFACWSTQNPKLLNAGWSSGRGPSGQWYFRSFS